MPSFGMVGAEAGLAFERNDDIRGLHRIVEANGGGVAVFDFDGDGLLDIFLTNGCRLPRERGDEGSPSQLYRNRGRMQFETVTHASSLAQFGYATGCAVGDYDADGFDDLYVTAFGPNALWHNNGDGTFADATRAASTPARWGTSAAFGDINGDGHLDLYVANYLQESDVAPKLCPNAASPDGYEQCPPAKFEGSDDVLFLSDGAGQLVDVASAAGLAGLRGKGLGVVISDLDADGRPEIFVANDGEANFLFVVNVDAAGAGALDDAHGVRPSVRLRDVALSSGVALNASGYAQANMGIAAGDYDANGLIDLFITTFYGDTNTLFANRGGLVFEDATRPSRLGATTREKLGFGTAFLDFDNDGRLDLFAVNGHIDDRTWMPHGEPYRMRAQIFRNEGDQTFVDVSESSGEYFLKQRVGRGLAIGDLDRDGRIDAVVSHQLAPSIALRNETETRNGSLFIRLAGTSSNRNGFGARVELLDADQVVVRELTGGGSFQSAAAPEVHVGLGANSKASIRIHWPAGHVATYSGLSAGTWLAVEDHGMHRFRQ